MPYDPIVDLLDIRLQSDCIPTFSTGPVEDGESDMASHLVIQLGSLQNHIRRFDSAVTLFEFAEDLGTAARMRRKELKHRTPRDVAQDWQFTACETCALQIYHVRSVLNSLILNLRECPAWAAEVDSKKLGKALTFLTDSFPFIKQIRDSVGHAADKRFAPRDFEKHAAAPNVLISGSLFNNEYIFDHRKVRTSLLISRDSLQSLIEVRDRVYEAFVEKSNERLGMKLLEQLKSQAS